MKEVSNTITILQNSIIFSTIKTRESRVITFISTQTIVIWGDRPHTRNKNSKTYTHTHTVHKHTHTQATETLNVVTKYYITKY